MVEVRPERVARFREDLGALLGALPTRLALAVSGGPDSLALLLLAEAAFPGGVEAATVDHGLRAEAPGEAADVARVCAGLGVSHETLRVRVVDTGEGMQAAARAARYSALGAWMARRGLAALLTAHHLDDQAETLAMRLLRGSGVGGLAGVRARRRLRSCGDAREAFLYRPLLGWRRSELAEIVAAAGLEPSLDPGNVDERYDRARIRRHLAQAPWIDPVALARSAAALADADDALTRIADDLFATRVARDNDALILSAADLPVELTRRLLLRCVRALAPDAAPRGEQLATLLATLERGESATLAGVKCSGRGTTRLERAPPRRTVGPRTHA